MRYCDVGCDLDGVLADGFTPQEAEYAIISGRHVDDWPRTIGQIGTRLPIYLRPPHFPGESGEWKAAMILAIGIRKFYEDMPDQAAIIRRIAPSCAVHLVANGQVVKVLS